jgi:hypothetical protein
MSAPTQQRYVATRTIAASPAEVFAVLADPMRHKDTEPGDWVRDAVSTEPITRVGQIFVMNMFFEAAGGHYVVHNLVTEFERGRTIGWLPGQLDEMGNHDAGGWWWRYDLEPNGSNPETTDVTLTYDWTGTPQEFRDQVGGMPVFPVEFIEESLQALERAVS